MKTIYSFVFTLIMCGVHTAFAQRYMDEIFTDVNVTTGVTYGVNATILYYGVLGEAIPEELKMDIYQPAGDWETNRPLILYFHTGNFLPHPQNGSPGGLRTDSSVVELCKRFARMGYVVASCDYRLGWNPIAETQPERVYTLINAAYRGVQDCRTAVRYFRMTHQEMNNPYGIDPNRIAVWGQGTGGYIAFAAATINNYITDIATLPKFVWDPSGEGTPQPMVIEFVNGNPDGTTWGINPGDDLISTADDDTLNYVNWPDYSSTFNTMVNMGGAMGDLSWLEDNMMPMISIHVPTDPFAPYGEGTVIVPVLNLPVVDVSGSYSVQQAANAFGNNAIFQSVQGDRLSDRANAVNNGYYGLFPLVRPAGQEADSAPWEWWASSNPNNANGLQTNPNMSPEKGRAFCDSIQWYVTPRLACALQLPGNPCDQGRLNDPCQLALSIDAAFTDQLNTAVQIGPFSNYYATVGNDPQTGWDCWLEPDGDGETPSLDNSVWFWFEGDGSTYTVKSDNCNNTLTKSYIEFGDTQFALYSGSSCTNLVPVLCNDDSEFVVQDNYFSEMTIATEPGVTYWLLVDGFNYGLMNKGQYDPAIGEWCFQVTNTFVSVEENLSRGFIMYPNPASDRLNVQAKEMIRAAVVYNTSGAEVKRIGGMNSASFTLDTNELSSGLYMLSLQFDSGISTSTFVVER